MAKATTTSTDVGLIGSVSITADGATSGITIPEGRDVELSISVPLGVTASIRASYDAGATFPFLLTPSSLSVIDATSAAQAVTMKYRTEEPHIQLRVDGTGFGVGDTLTFRVSGAAKT